MMQKKRHAIERTPCKIFRGGGGAGRKRPIINSQFKTKKEDIKSMKNSLEQKRRKLKKDRAAGMCICIKSCGNGALYGIAVLRCCAIQK